MPSSLALISLIQATYCVGIAHFPFPRYSHLDALPVRGNSAMWGSISDMEMISGWATAPMWGIAPA